MKKMKKETIWRTLGIFIMLLVSVLWLGAAQVSAAELKTENGDTQGVLQNGGLLVRKAKGDVSSYALANQSEIETRDISISGAGRTLIICRPA